MKQKIAQLIYDQEHDRLSFDGEDLHCGDCFEVMVFNGLKDDQPEWVSTRLEYDDGWYLVGLVGYQPAGLFARR